MLILGFRTLLDLFVKIRIFCPKLLFIKTEQTISMKAFGKAITPDRILRMNFLVDGQSYLIDLIFCKR